MHCPLVLSKRWDRYSIMRHIHLSSVQAFYICLIQKNYPLIAFLMLYAANQFSAGKCFHSHTVSWEFFWHRYLEVLKYYILFLLFYYYTSVRSCLISQKDEDETFCLFYTKKRLCPCWIKHFDSIKGKYFGIFQFVQRFDVWCWGSTS